MNVEQFVITELPRTNDIDNISHTRSVNLLNFTLTHFLLSKCRLGAFIFIHSFCYSRYHDALISLYHAILKITSIVHSLSA